MTQCVATVWAIGALFPMEAMARVMTPPVGDLCPQIILVGKLRPNLSAVEKRLVCGDPDQSDAVGDSWHRIPLAQAKLSMTTFLQDRGFYRPVFKTEGERLRVELGEATYVTLVTPVDVPPEVDLNRKRNFHHELLTPKLLSGMEQWIYARLQSVGYPCPFVSSEADPDTGEVRLIARPGNQLNLIAVKEEPVESLAPGILRRYDAFQLEQRYNGDLVALTERRISAQEILQSVHYTVTCDKDGATLKQTTISGAPRLLSVGFGANTEVGPLVKASWTNTRLGLAGSLFDVTATGSLIKQSLNTSLTWFPSLEPSRKYLKPTFIFQHDNIAAYETLNSSVGFFPGTSWDDNHRAVSVKAGPSIGITRTLRGEGAPTSRSLSLEMESRYSSHYYEFFSGSPRAGFQAIFTGSLSSRDVLSDVTAQRFQLLTESLWNLGEKDPPWLILALRTGVTTTFTPERVGAVGSRLTPALKTYLGGSLDLRGFGLNELTTSPTPPNPHDPNTSPGGLSSAFAGFEARLDVGLPWSIQPLAFVDVGALGAGPASLMLPIYWSPGAGLRVESPVGVLRATLAHGFVSGTPQSLLSHFQFFFSFGEEF